MSAATTAARVSGTIRRTSDLTDADYERAIGVMVRHQRVSTSLVQRELGLVYNAAAKLVERAEAEGIVTRPNEVGARFLAARKTPPPLDDGVWQTEQRVSNVQQPDGRWHWVNSCDGTHVFVERWEADERVEMAECATFFAGYEAGEADASSPTDLSPHTLREIEEADADRRKA